MVSRPGPEFIDKYTYLQLVKELDSIMREIIDIKEESACHEETIHDLYQKLVQGEAIVNSHPLARFSLDSYGLKM
jgi:hypothetical protein